jgi:hypothetical protein
MSVEQAILEAVRALPADRQNEILEHAQRLRQEPAVTPRRRGKGLGADLGVNLSELDENQREIWKSFARDGH